MAGDMDAWKTLIEYNKADVLDLERIYLKIRAWDHLHPSASTHSPTAGRRVCTVCGSENVRATEKTVATAASVFQLFTCGDCGHHMRSRQSLLTTAQAANSLQNAK